ncbi:hypothetical protein BGX34_007375 [Mortierella sp. NVP85]|nr:hypothetical protein BGX34_007375 [Mortierella sp. NVP85]
MRFTTSLFALASALLVANTPVTLAADPVVGGYLLINPTTGAAKLKALADHAANIPINRLFLSFARPTMVYVAGSKTLEHVGLGYGTSGDFGFADLKAQITKLQAGGVEVLLSMGGWNYGCYPYLYTYYSVGGYGEKTPNFYKIQKYAEGHVSGCTEANMWCYTCEPEEQHTTLADFDIFPEPSYSPTWQAAEDYVRKGAQGGTPIFQHDMIPGRSWADPKTHITTTVPGSDYFYKQQRDPYEDLVLLAQDLGLAGVDIDYEEMWHADYYKSGTGPWTNYQTVYKYAAIMRDVQLNIQKHAPKMKLGTASAAVGALSSDWWGGNLKGIWYWVFKWYPEVYNFAATGANSGGVNVMSYDLSSNEQFYECPQPNLCSLHDQVNFYLKSYKDAGMAAHVGYEIGTPAYPAKDHDPNHQLPLTQPELTDILHMQGKNGGFFWELYKPADDAKNVDATTAAQQICKAALGDATPRCTGTIPQPNAHAGGHWVGGGDEQHHFSYSEPESHCNRRKVHYQGY